MNDKTFFRKHRQLLKGMPEAKRFRQNIVVSQYGNWAYQLTGKSGSSTMLSYLFELDFGCPFKVNRRDQRNIHPEFALFAVKTSGVWTNAHQLQLSFKTNDFLRIALVRDPVSRVVSAFRYICQSQTAGDERFLNERIRLNAIVKFDWENDPDTDVGFEKFLDYIEWVMKERPQIEWDAHWMPQYVHIVPEIYKPNLLGKLEDFDAFTVKLCARLDKPHLAPKRRVNVSSKPETPLPTDTIKRRIRDIYERDYETFGY